MHFISCNHTYRSVNDVCGELITVCSENVADGLSKAWSRCSIAIGEMRGDLSVSEGLCYRLSNLEHVMFRGTMSNICSVLVLLTFYYEAVPTTLDFTHF